MGLRSRMLHQTDSTDGWASGRKGDACSRMKARVAELQLMFAELDAEIIRGARATGLTCRPMCGQCCEFPGIHLSLADAMPLAFELCRDHRGEDMLAALRAQSAADESRGGCPMYRPLTTDSKTTSAGTAPHGAADASGQAYRRGRCTAYGARPGLCRLFGFARSSDSPAVLLACQMLKEDFRDNLVLQRAGHDSLSAAPQMDAWQRRIAAVFPDLDARPQPIRTTIRQALELVLHAQGYASSGVAST